MNVAAQRSGAPLETSAKDRSQTKGRESPSPKPQYTFASSSRLDTRHPYLFNPSRTCRMMLKQVSWVPTMCCGWIWRGRRRLETETDDERLLIKLPADARQLPIINGLPSLIGMTRQNHQKKWTCREFPSQPVIHCHPSPLRSFHPLSTFAVTLHLSRTLVALYTMLTSYSPLQCR